MNLPGIVTNVTAFGAFVDIGVHQDGLVHISELSDKFVKNPADVVKVQVFLTDIADRAAINPRRIAYFGESRPASSLFEVSALVDPRMSVEIECQAYVEGG